MLFQEYLGCSQIIGSINADGLDIGHAHLYTIAGREPAELLQTLSLLQRCLRQLCDSLQYLALA